MIHDERCADRQDRLERLTDEHNRLRQAHGSMHRNGILIGRCSMCAAIDGPRARSDASSQQKEVGRE